MLRNTGGLAATLSGGRAGFQNENPPTVPLGSTVTAQPMNDFQENICAVVEATNIALSNSDSIGGNGQLFQAVRRLAGAAYTLISATATLTADEAGRIVVNASGGNVVLTLPLAASMSASYAGGGATSANSVGFDIWRSDSSAYTVTVQTAGSDGLDFATLAGTSFQIPGQTKATFFSDANATWIMAVSPPAPGLTIRKEYNTPGTFYWTAPAGKTLARSKVVGGGGGGGGTKQSGDAAMAGAGSSCATFDFPIVPGTTYTITVGAGGTGGTSGSSPTAGGVGGTSSIYNGSTLVANTFGGNGGVASPGSGVVTTLASAGSYAPGAGTTTTGADAGTNGNSALTLGGTLLNAMGGAPLGIAAAPVSTTAPVAPVQRGMGGWGGINGGPGATGGPGYVEIEC